MTAPDRHPYSQEEIGAMTLRAAAESFRLVSERSFSGLDVAEILEASAATIEN